MRYLCKNPDCSPLAPLVGEPLRYGVAVDKTRSRCPQCRCLYFAEIQAVGAPCPQCGVELQANRVRFRYCAKCGVAQ